MKIIYIDSDYKCHVSNGDNMAAVETSVFDGKCDFFIEGRRFIPYGRHWVRSDGVIFHGEMITPWMDPAVLDAAQLQYEIMLAEIDAAYQRGVNSV